MKILIAYDGSESADIAIDGLQRAGLPNENVEALRRVNRRSVASAAGWR